MIINQGVKVRFGADMKGLTRGLAKGKLAVGGFATAAAAALAGVTVASVRMAAQLDRDLRLVSTLGGEAAGNTEALRKEVQQLGVEFGRNFNEIARANYQAVSGGFKDIAQSMELTRAGTRLAVAGNADLVGSTEAVVKALNAFDMEAGDAEKAAAQLWGITRDGIITVEQLGRFLADLPVAAASSGIEFEEMSAAISTLTAAGVPASTAMDQLRSAIIQLEKRGITGTLVERMERFVGQGIGELSEQLGDQTAARGVLVLANNLETFNGNVEAAGDVLTDYNAAVETMNDGPMAEWNQAQQGLNDIMTSFGNEIMPIATQALEGFNSALSSLDAGKLDDLLRRLTAGTPLGFLTLLGQPSGYEGIPQGVLPDPAGPANRGAREGPFFPTPTGAAVPTTADELGANQEGVTQAGSGGTDVAPQGGAGQGAGRSPLYTYLDQRTVIGQQDPLFELRESRLNDMSQDTSGISIGGELGDFDFEGNADEIRDAHDAMQNLGSSSQFAAASAGILSSTVGGLLTSAFVTAESGAARFVQGMLAQFAQLGVNALVSTIFPGFAGGFAGGGFTGSIGAGNVAGVVHGNEYVFNADAVRSLGLGRLERMHQVAKAGNTSNTVNVTVNAGSGDAASVAQLTADAVGTKMRELTTTSRGNFYKPASAKYGGV